MARQTAPLPTRSQFIRDQYSRNPTMSAADVIRAWNAAGGEEEISPALVYIVKSKMKSPVKASARSSSQIHPTPAPTAPVRTPLAEDRGSGAYEAIESGLDELVGLSMKLGDASLASALRTARRSVSAKLVE